MSDYQVPKFIKRSGDALLFSGEGEFLFYVPETFFERKTAEIEAGTVEHQEGAVGHIALAGGQKDEHDRDKSKQECEYRNKQQ